MADFWQALDTLVSESKIIIDRPRGSAHPRYPDLIYPLDYGYLSNTASTDGEGIDIWLGSMSSREVVAVICTVDLINRDSEMKVLIGCTDEEIETIFEWCNNTSGMKGALIKRGIQS